MKRKTVGISRANEAINEWEFIIKSDGTLMTLCCLNHAKSCLTSGSLSQLFQTVATSDAGAAGNDTVPVTETAFLMRATSAKSAGLTRDPPRPTPARKDAHTSWQWFMYWFDIIVFLIVFIYGWLTVTGTGAGMGSDPCLSDSGSKGGWTSGQRLRRWPGVRPPLDAGARTFTRTRGAPNENRLVSHRERLDYTGTNC